MSALPKKNWTFFTPLAEEVFSLFPEIDHAVVQVLHNRGLTTQEAIDEFLHPDYAQGVHDPFLFVDMRRAVDRIFSAIERQEKILVYGDYDGDGICGSALLLEVLQSLGAKNIDLYLPHRATEGYGLNMPAVERFGRDGVNLLITVDCGSTSVAEVALANRLHMEVIILDHHAEPEEHPAAYAIINPSFSRDAAYPWKYLCGTGVAFKVAQALFAEKKRRDGDSDKWEREEKWLLDLVAIGTVMDMVTLLGENRTLTKYGLIVLQKTKRIGLRKLYASGGVDASAIDTQKIGYVLGPRINAAGRMNHASVASKLLLTAEEDEAMALAQELEVENKKRQQRMAEMISEAKEQIGDPGEKKLIAAIKEGWEPGVVGLVAGRVMEVFALPTIILGIKENGDVIGSGRSIESFNITAALKESEEFLRAYGGHPQACGFTLKSREAYDPFVANMARLAAEALRGVDTRPHITIDAAIRLQDITWDFLHAITLLEPFGQKSPAPLFIVRGASIVAADSVGSDKRHVRLLLEQGGITKKAIAFRFGDVIDVLTPETLIDVVCDIGVNEWNGNKEIQLKVVDIQASEA